MVDENNDILDVDVYDWDKGSNNDLLGVAHVPVASVTTCGTLERAFNLTKRHGTTKKNLGSVTLKLVYYDQAGKVPGGAQAAAAPGAMTPDQMAANAFRQVCVCGYVYVRWC